MSDIVIGLRLAEMEPSSYFRSLLTNRVGHLVAKEQYDLRVVWEDGRGPTLVHRELVVEPWARPDRAFRRKATGVDGEDIGA